MIKFSTINVCGTDAFEFLQGQLTNDLRQLDKVPEIRAAWCSPKGRVIWFGTVSTVDDGYALVTPADIADSIVQRLTMFRFRSKVAFEIAECAVNFEAERLIEMGMPYIGKSQSEQFTPHMLNLDKLNAISLDKGCYTGQEIVARTHYKGTTKRRTLRFKCDATVAVGDKITSSGRVIGAVLNEAGQYILAVVSVSAVSETLRIGDTRVTLSSLPYEIE